jgi:hypothetical protein
VSRLLFGLQRLGKFKTGAAQGPVVVLVLDRDRIAEYQKKKERQIPVVVFERPELVVERARERRGGHGLLPKRPSVYLHRRLVA